MNNRVNKKKLQELGNNNKIKCSYTMTWPNQWIKNRLKRFQTLKVLLKTYNKKKLDILQHWNCT